MTDKTKSNSNMSLNSTSSSPRPLHKQHQLENVLEKLRKDRYTHNMASNYYEKLNYRIIFPSVFITGVSSIAAFLATSEQIPDDAKQYFTLMIGILTSTSAILQSLSGACGFETRKELFKKAALGYDELISKTIFEINNPNEPDFFDTLEEEMKKVKANCNYLPPTWIVDQWENRDIEKETNQQEKKKKDKNEVEYLNNTQDDEYTHYRTFEKRNNENLGKNEKIGINNSSINNNENNNENNNNDNDDDGSMFDGILQGRNIDLSQLQDAFKYANENVKPLVNNLVAEHV